MNIQTNEGYGIKIIKMDKGKKRLYYLDNLKIFLVILVITHHVGQAYGPTGGFWQYTSSLHENISWLGLFFAVNAAFFMGLFFMISGYFFPGSYDRKGAAKFLTDKLVRYGIPVLAVFFIMSPLEMYFHYMNYTANVNLNFFDYFIRIYLGIGGKPDGFISSIGFPEMNFGHAWFIEHLLVYSILYVGIRQLIRVDIWGKFKIMKMREYVLIFTLGLVIAIVSKVVRIWYPIDKWIALFGFIQSEIAHLPQYITLFIAGMVAYRLNWFEKFSKHKGYIILTMGLVMALGIYTIRMLPDAMRSFIWDKWVGYESLMAVCLCFGLVVLFREKINITNKVMRWLSDNSYAAYIIHFPVVLTIQYMLDKVVIFGALGKFITVSILSISITYMLSYLIRKIPKMIFFKNNYAPRIN